MAGTDRFQLNRQPVTDHEDRNPFERQSRKTIFLSRFVPRALLAVIKRPGRKEPRVCKDRQNKFTLMTKPRHLYDLNDDAKHAA